MISSQKQKNHVVDMLFTIALFCVFIVTAFSVILIGANVYRSIVEKSASNDETGIVLAYVAEKVRTFDENGEIFIGSLDGEEALCLRQEIQKETYITYIYEYQGSLYELFVKEGNRFHREDGTELLKVEKFSMEQQAYGILSFEVADSQGYEFRLLLHPKSEGGDAE